MAWRGRRGPCFRSLVAGAAALFALAALPAAADGASRHTVWLCRPGVTHDPCTPPMATTHLANDGSVIKVDKPPIDRHPRIDCFYLYPTVSDDPGSNSDLSIDPEERSIALYQAARYSQECRVFAPMYRQVTLAQLLKGARTITPAMRRLAYESALSGWKEYLRRYSHGRPFVLIGHSQGTFVLRELIRQEIDPHRRLRRRLVSAILLGGNVVVRKESRVGGDFEHVPSCRSRADFGCVIAWSTFNAPVPPNSFFGRSTRTIDGRNGRRFHTLCRYPGSPHLRTVLPSAPFAPGTTIGAATQAIGYPAMAPVSTPWREYDQAYRGRCSSTDSAHVLQIAGEPGVPRLNAVPSARFGLHFTDANIALGNLTAIVRRQERAYFRASG
jgi:Protein of unknown function (DUF3089)